MPLTTPQRQRQVVAALKRHRPESAELQVAYSDLAAANLEAYIRRTVDAAPPLTPEQRDRLASLLRGGAA